MSKYMNSLSVSQNFLTSQSLIRRIVGLSSIDKSDVVVEIGAGKGHLTRELCKTCKKVVAIEYDTKLYKKLLEMTPVLPNAQLICCDFLKWNTPNTEYKVFANIPFNRTTAIVKKLLFSNHPPKEAWLVVEKGAAKRFMGTPRESLASLLIKPFFDAKVIYHFRKDDFHPAPSVDAVLLHFTRKPSPDIDPSNCRKYHQFITDCMGNRGRGIRKYLTNKQINAALRSLSSDITSGETLYIQWLCLFRCYLRCGK